MSIDETRALLELGLAESCSWCEELNSVENPPVYCSNCGHRADVPRINCDCDVCREISFRAL